MSFFDDLLSFFTGKKKVPSPPPQTPPPKAGVPPKPPAAPPKAPAPPKPPAAEPITEVSGVTGAPIAAPETPAAPPPLAGPVPPPAQVLDFLEGLRAESKAPLTREDFEASAKRLGCEPEAVMAVVAVESGASGFDAKTGRPLILFEPHWFSRLTTPKRKYDATHPNISYVSWDPKKYPKTQEGRWAQLEEAYALDPEAALSAASWGRFQVMGFNFALCGFKSASAMVAALAKSEVAQLQAFEAFVVQKDIDDDLERLDWAGFAYVYNGPSYKDNKYDTKLAAAYDKAKKESEKLAKKQAKA